MVYYWLLNERMLWAYQYILFTSVFRMCKVVWLHSAETDLWWKIPSRWYLCIMGSWDSEYSDLQVHRSIYGNFLGKIVIVFLSINLSICFGTQKIKVHIWKVYFLFSIKHILWNLTKNCFKDSESILFKHPKHVYMCFVVTCWERADLLALVCGV